MELRVLRYFLVVAIEENITKAADVIPPAHAAGRRIGRKIISPQQV